MSANAAWHRRETAAGRDRGSLAGIDAVNDGSRLGRDNEDDAGGLARQMHARFPAAEREELSGYFRDYGADPDTAARMAAAVSRDPDTALRVHSREELGVDPEDLPSPLLAGAASLLAFSFGALVPLLPYLAGAPVLAVMLALTAVALVTGGMAVGRLTGRPVLRSGLRQLAFGSVAIAVTYLVGHLIGGHGT